MDARRYLIITLLLCFCLCLMPCVGRAASTTDAVEPIAPERQCDLTVSYCYDGTAFENVTVQLYRVAAVAADFQYTLTPAFAPSGLVLNGVQTNGEWNVIRSTLEANILAYSIEADVTAVTDQMGNVRFEALETGLYLAIVGRVTQGELTCEFDSALIALPGLGEDGRWQYHLSVASKCQYIPPVEPDKQITLKILKLWRGDEGRTDRPQTVKVEIFRDGVSYETAVLSEENHWSYSWTAKDDGARWMVVERNIPVGYAVTVEERGTSFVLTNTLESDDPDTPIKPPPTGDTANVLLYILLMVLSGGVLMVLGVTGKRKQV